MCQGYNLLLHCALPYNLIWISLLRQCAVTLTQVHTSKVKVTQDNLRSEYTCLCPRYNLLMYWWNTIQLGTNVFLFETCSDIDSDTYFKALGHAIHLKVRRKRQISHLTNNRILSNFLIVCMHFNCFFHVYLACTKKSDHNIKFHGYIHVFVGELIKVISWSSVLSIEINIQDKIQSSLNESHVL